MTTVFLVKFKPQSKPLTQRIQIAKASRIKNGGGRSACKHVVHAWLLLWFLSPYFCEREGVLFREWGVCLIWPRNCMENPMGSVGFVNRKNWLLESFSMLRFSSLTEAIFWQIILGEFILRHTSDVNGSNFSVSRLLCSRGNTCSSKPPKYTFKSQSTRLTSLLTLYQIKIRKL